MLAKLRRAIKRKLREIADGISLRRANNASGKPGEILTLLEEEADIARFDWPGGEKSVYPSSYRVVIPRYGHFWDVYYRYQASDAERRFERLLKKHIEGPWEMTASVLARSVLTSKPSTKEPSFMVGRGATPTSKGATPLASAAGTQ